MKGHKDTTGFIFNIQRFSLENGPGIRTTVFLKGCPLSCLWCHNPESQEMCTRAGGERDVRSHITGWKASVDEIMHQVERDLPFYHQTEGGLSISGGEPLMQQEFTMALLEEAKKKKIHTCLDTSGYALLSEAERLIGAVDLFLYDIKGMDAAKHLKNTGGNLDLILKNLKLIDRLGGRILLRCPMIPGYNDDEEEIQRIGSLAEELNGVEEIDLIPYHDYWRYKLTQIGRKSDSFSSHVPEKKEKARWMRLIRGRTKKRIRLL